MIAVLSDIHANLAALEAVLADAETAGATQVFCLGDVVGYGPDSIDCLRRAQAFDVTLAGDWEWGLIAPDPSHWVPPLYRQLTRLHDTIHAEPDGEELLAWITGWSDAHRTDGCLFVHGTPESCRDYLFPEDVYNAGKIERMARLAGGPCFTGHTHLAGIFAPNESGEWNYLESAAIEDDAVRLESPMIVNVGSVGQPRDGDRRAAYVLMDEGTLRFRRVDYDFESTARKLRDDGDDSNGDRLGWGR